MFPSKEELLRNMMGLLGNVAEVKFLRPVLMSERFVSVFTELLGSGCDGIEVTFGTVECLQVFDSFPNFINISLNLG